MNLRIFILILSVISCNGTNREKNKSLFEQQVTNWHYKKLTPRGGMLNDTTKIAFFQDSISGNSYAIYLKTDIEAVSESSVINQNVKPGLLNKKYLVLVNDRQVDGISLNDSRLLIPTGISSFVFKGKTYTLISMQLMSFIGNQFWCSILFINDKKYVIESKDRLIAENFGDYDADGNLDYYLRKSSSPSDESDSIIFYSLQQK